MRFCQVRMSQVQGGLSSPEGLLIRSLLEWPAMGGMAQGVLESCLAIKSPLHGYLWVESPVLAPAIKDLKMSWGSAPPCPSQCEIMDADGGKEQAEIQQNLLEVGLGGKKMREGWGWGRSWGKEGWDVSRCRYLWICSHCHSKQWPWNTKMCYLLVLEVGSLKLVSLSWKPRCQQGCVPSETQRVCSDFFRTSLQFVLRNWPARVS